MLHYSNLFLTKDVGRVQREACSLCIFGSVVHIVNSPMFDTNANSQLTMGDPEPQQAAISFSSIH